MPFPLTSVTMVYTFQVAQPAPGPQLTVALINKMAAIPLPTNSTGDMPALTGAVVTQDSTGLLDPFVNTTIPLAIVANILPQTVAPVSMTNIFITQTLIINQGQPDQELVSVLGTTPGIDFTAVFNLSHGPGATVTSWNSVGVGTTVALPVAAGLQEVTPASMVNIIPGISLEIEDAPNLPTNEVVVVTSVTATTFSAVFRNPHLANFSVGSATAAAIIQRTITYSWPSTTSVGAVTAPGVAVITPVSMTNIFIGAFLLIDAGTPQQENVQVTAINPGVSFTATFQKAHIAGFGINGQINIEFPFTADNAAPFRDLYTYVLRNGMASGNITAAEPALA